MTWEWTPTSAIAFYAAIVSTVTAAWNIRNALRDAPHLKLDLRFRQIVPSAHGDVFALDVTDLKVARLVLTITNTGRRPITIMKWMGRYQKPQPGGEFFFVVSSGLPAKLEESQQNVQVADAFSKVFAIGVRTMFVTDSSDREWRVPRRELRRVEREYKRLVQKSQPTATGKDP